MKVIIATLVLSCSVSWSTLATAETVKLQVAGGEIAAPPSQGDRILLNLTLDSSRDLSEFTLRHVGKDIDVLINNNVVVSPHIIDRFYFLDSSFTFRFRQAQRVLKAWRQSKNWFPES
ncbi:hypothetical protein [Rhizobium leguminosarum]|uniref:hypothetical protein n=1 Tax=Rhizobium leguminosarum TaxID=384 RepID=UPI001FEE87F6|nr:hypothetical protein [Rhizobium leguminosarum]